MSAEKDAHEGLEKFARSNGINYEHARAEMIQGDATEGWKHLEYARDHRSKVERNCVLAWLGLLAERGAASKGGAP
jgi:hypothetical protein